MVHLSSPEPPGRAEAWGTGLSLGRPTLLRLPPPCPSALTAHGRVPHSAVEFGWAKIGETVWGP